MPRRSVPHSRVVLKTPADQERMRRAGRVVAQALARVGEALRPGITTEELDSIAARVIHGMGATPSFLGYRGYPATACISVNDEVVHGIPGKRQLRMGDVVGVDLGAMVDGLHADAARTFAVGDVTETALRLMKVGQECLDLAIAAALPGNRIRDIGRAVETHALSHGYSVVKVLCGHGIGRSLHEDPQVPNYVDRGGTLILQAGMALAIEPMVNGGTDEVDIDGDGWTFRTADGALSVHYEHTVIIQPGGPEVITAHL